MPQRYTGEAQLTTRVTAHDNLMIRRLFGLEPGSTSAAFRPARLVVDAHTPVGAGGDDVRLTASEAGVPYLIDPETPFLQGEQHDGAAWLRLPFATKQPVDPSALAGSAAQRELVRSVIDYQLTHGATQVIAPYVHVERPGSQWSRVQAGRWRETATYVKEARIRLPLIAIVAVGWRCLHPLQGRPALMEMWNGLTALHPAEVGLAVSKVHLGVRPADRITEMLMLVDHLSRDYVVTMWQQGLLGEAAVIAGAAGYECGIGWRESCDMQNRMAQQRKPRKGPAGPRPVYIPELGRSISKARLRLAHTKRSVWTWLVCPFADCCAPGGDDLLGDARRHSVISRARELTELSATQTVRWRWNRLALRMAGAVRLARRLNRIEGGAPQVDVALLEALYRVADVRRARPGIITKSA